MVTPNSDESHNPWRPVYGNDTARGPVAPSRPAMPASNPAEPRPEPIDAEDADLVAPVSPPPPEEILPWEAPPPADTPSSQPTPPPSDDAFRMLGETALRSAALSASGAPTSPTPATPPTAPTSAPAEPDSPFLGDTTRGAFPPVFHDDEAEPGYTPHFSAITASASADQKAGDGRSDGDDAPAKRRPWWRSAPVLIVAGLLVMGAIGYGLYELFSPRPEVELTAPVVVATPVESTAEPVAIDDPTDFQSALPGNVGAHTLTEVDTPDPLSLELEVRAAEAAILVYADGSSSLTVRAIQHYDTEAAVAQFEALAAGATDRAPVDAEGDTVGERVTVSAGDDTTIVWRNLTAVFELTGPAGAVEAFYGNFPL